MKLHTIWEKQEAEFTCLDAWDEDAIYLNSAGWQEALADAKQGSEGEVRVLIVSIPDAAVRELFEDPVARGLPV